MTRTLTTTGRLLVAAAAELRHPRLWLPAALLLLPTLCLQLAFPHWLRTRLSPSMATVVVGSLLIVWVTQVAAAASWGWVDAARRQRKVRRVALARAALRVGTVTTAGLLAGVVPGLWLQARLARLPLQRDAAEAEPPAAAGAWPLVALSIVALVVALLGQSLAAGLAEALGTIVPAAVVDGRVQFRLNYLPHLVTSVLAYGWTVFALTWQAIGVSLAHDTAAAVSKAPISRHERVRRVLPMRAAAIGLLVALVAGLVAAVHKVQQHVY